MASKFYSCSIDYTLDILITLLDIQIRALIVSDALVLEFFFYCFNSKANCTFINTWLALLCTFFYQSSRTADGPSWIKTTIGAPLSCWIAPSHTVHFTDWQLLTTAYQPLNRTPNQWPTYLSTYRPTSLISNWHICPPTNSPTIDNRPYVLWYITIYKWNQLYKLTNCLSNITPLH